MTVIESIQVKQESPPKGRMLLIGDLIIDRTWHVDVHKISPEAPVPVASLNHKSPIETPGAGGLGATFATKYFPDMETIFLTATTRERAGWLHSKGIKNVIPHFTTENIIKTRYIDKESRYHLLRVDNDEVIDPPEMCNEHGENFLKKIREITEKKIDVICMLDYRKGLFNDINITQQVIEIAKELNIPSFVDSRATNLDKFNGIDYLKLNKREFFDAQKTFNSSSYFDLLKKVGARNLLKTLAEEGAKLYNIETQQITAYKDYTKYAGAVDVTGCGDAFDISFCYYCFIEGKTPQDALRLAVNKATYYAHQSIEERLC